MKKKVGILGGGQLGCMLAESLLKYGAQVSFYDPNLQSPAAFRFENFTCAQWDDEAHLTSFFSANDVVVFEFENVSTTLLSKVIKVTGTPLYPSEQVLYTTQNRIREKSFMRAQGLPVCEFVTCISLEEFKKHARTMNFPYIVKTAEGGYDGKGQWYIADSIALADCIKEQKNANSGLIIEEVVPFVKEVSVIVARDLQGEAVCFPVFENIHRNHILDYTLAPAQIDVTLSEGLKKTALTAAAKLNVVGLLTTEFFIIPKDPAHPKKQFVINEFAPRPHNSGHITRNCCQLSQFDALARILIGLPLIEPKLLEGHFCMGNILGEHFPEVVDVVFYGKDKAQSKRKMGHFVTKAENSAEALKLAKSFRKDR